MFTLEQIKSAHSKVKTGADFPAYAREIQKLGVHYYETFVEDGHTNYFGAEKYEISSDSRYKAIEVSKNSNSEQFKKDLASHQKGMSDYLQFTRDCASSGVEKWAVCLDTMTCTYFDRAGNKMLVEKIP
jgi:uncharacterized protein YbcV (DUF1398 family)